MPVWARDLDAAESARVLNSFSDWLHTQSDRITRRPPHPKIQASLPTTQFPANAFDVRKPFCGRNFYEPFECSAPDWRPLRIRICAIISVNLLVIG